MAPRKQKLTVYLYYMNESLLARSHSKGADLSAIVKESNETWRLMDEERRAVWRQRLEKMVVKKGYKYHGRLLQLIGELGCVDANGQPKPKFSMAKLEIPRTHAEMRFMRQRNRQMLCDMWDFQLSENPMELFERIYCMAGVWPKDEAESLSEVEVCIVGFTLSEGVVFCFYDFYDTGDVATWKKLALDAEEITFTRISEINFLVPLINYVAFEKLIKRAQAERVCTDASFSVKVFYAEDFFIALKLWVDKNHEALKEEFTAAPLAPVPRIACRYHRKAVHRSSEPRCCPVDFLAYFMLKKAYDIDESTKRLLYKVAAMKFFYTTASEGRHLA